MSLLHQELFVLNGTGPQRNFHNFIEGIVLLSLVLSANLIFLLNSCS